MGIFDGFAKLIGQGSERRLPSPSGTSVGNRISYPNAAGYVTKVENAYKKNPIVAACVGLITSTMNEAPLGVQNPDGTVNLNHPVAITFRRPNAYMGQAQFWSATWTFLEMSGNAYLKKLRGQAGNIAGYVPYGDAHVTPFLDNYGWVAGYLYSSNGVTQTWNVEDVIHLRNPLYSDPLRMHMGLSPIDVAWSKIQTYNELSATIYSLVASNAVPSGILTAPGEVDGKGVALLKQQLAKRRDAKGKERTEPLVLSNGMTYVQMGLDAAKLQATENLRELEASICAAFRIHPAVIGSSAGLAVSTYNNLTSAYVEYTRLTRVPFWNAVEEQIEAGLAHEYPGVQLAFDLEQVAALQPEFDANQVIAEFNANLITLNESRSRLGFDPVEGGDKYAYQVVPAPMFGGGIMSAPTESNPAEATQGPNAGTVDAWKADPIESTEGGRIKWVEPEAVKYWQAQNKIVEEAMKDTTKQAADMIDAARKGVMAKVKAPQDGVNVADLVRQFMTANKRTREKLARQIIELTIANTGTEFVDFAGVQSEIDQIIDVQTRETQKLMETSCETLKKDVARIAEANAGNREAMQEALTNRFDAIGPSRAAMIARTTCRAQATVVQNETVRGLNKRQQDPNKRFVNVWLSERDDDVRESHEELDGQWVEVGQSWDTLQPGITEGPGIGTDRSETINCRCVIRPTRFDRIRQ